MAIHIHGVNHQIRLQQSPSDLRPTDRYGQGGRDKEGDANWCRRLLSDVRYHYHHLQQACFQLLPSSLAAGFYSLVHVDYLGTPLMKHISRAKLR